MKSAISDITERQINRTKNIRLWLFPGRKTAEPFLYYTISVRKAGGPACFSVPAKGLENEPEIEAYKQGVRAPYANIRRDCGTIPVSMIRVL